MATTVTQEIFLARAGSIWEGRWDYSKTNYEKSNGRVVITCPEHGDFEQIAASHLRKSVGCARCASSGSKYTTSDFISRSKEVWGDRWDYSQTTYTNRRTHVKVSCPTHGEFTQLPDYHWLGKVGCPQCSGRSRSIEDYIPKFKEVWGERWDYSKTVYLGGSTKASFLCPLHGEFTQLLWDHSVGFVGCTGCSSVGTSNYEGQVADFIKSLGIQIQRSRRDLLGTTRMELDVFVPEKGVAFEFNGLYYHSEKFKDSDYHHTKFKLAEGAGIKLIQIWEDDWRDQQEIVKNHIQQVLEVSTLLKIPARKTEIFTPSSARAKEFFNAYHIQGFIGASVYLGLSYEGTVVALAAFKRQGQGYLLTRYATSANVQGGHSKLVSHFERNYDYTHLTTFADLTFGSGNLYKKTGWVEDKFMSPDYSYIEKGKRRHKFGYRLKRFREDPALKYEEGMTERELAKLNGLLRVHDAGKIRFIKPHPNSTDTIKKN